MTITTLDLIRHPESEMNFKFAHLIGGRSNHSPVTEKGYGQVDKFARRFLIEKPVYAATYVSPAVRTSEMARIVHEKTGAHPQMIVCDDVQEIDQGDWEGKPRKDHHTPEVIARIIDMKGRHKAPNGESQFEVERRMVAFAENCAAIHPGGRIAVYTHGLAIKCLLRFVQNWDPRKTYFTEIDNTSISTISYHHGIDEWRLDRVNDRAHLTLF